MNERIWELFRQANHPHPKHGGDDMFFPEEFAELIVQECIRYFNEDYQRDFDTLWREDLSKGIKEHFGVE